MRGFVRLALRTVTVAACVLDAVVFATTLALLETMSGMSALAVWDGADDFSV